MSDDLISRQAAIDDAHSQIWYRLNPNMKERMDKWLSELPSVQPEQKMGEWVYGEFDIPHCSICGHDVMPNTVSPYCPNCGAKMKSEDRNEDSKM